VLTLDRHGQTLRFDDSGFTEPPYVYRSLLKGQAYEEPFLEHIRKAGREGVYVDVGAHLGTHTVWFATLCPSTKVHAFEPVGRYAEVVRRNIADNGLEDKVTVHQVGLSAEAGSATNFMSTPHQVGFTEQAEGVTETFPVKRLDDVVRGPVAVIKIDVEGMEADVLKGARRILSRHRPAVYAESWDAEHAEVVLAALAPYGYRPTGKVFNSSPTHEYVAPPCRGLERLRPAYRLLPAAVRRRVRRLSTSRS
jgi:FkbM family methyltransferase